MTEITAVPEERWKDAQLREKEYWVGLNKMNSRLMAVKKFYGTLRRREFKTLFRYLKFLDFYCGDDSNYWWMEQFDGYKALPGSLGKALEVGCGPFTNFRLITKRTRTKDIYCCDPLIDAYRTFDWTWLSRKAAKGRIKTFGYMCEDLRFSDEYFDLTVCINVLDHVQDARRCLLEIDRVTRKGGFIVLGQDLSNEADVAYWEESKAQEIRDTSLAHPIKISHVTIDAELTGKYRSRFKKILPREKGRKPVGHYGTYLFIGQKA